MFEVEFSHHGDNCTFETLIQRFGIRDRAVLRLAEVIHDADVEDDKFHRVEGFGVEQIFKGWAKQGLVIKKFSRRDSNVLTPFTHNSKSDETVGSFRKPR